MSAQLLVEGRFLQLLAEFSKHYLDYASVEGLVEFAIELTKESQILNKVAYYTFDKDTLDFNFVAANQKNINGKELYDFLLDKGVISTVLSEVTKAFSYDDTSQESYLCLPIIGYDGVLGLFVYSSLNLRLETHIVFIERMTLYANLVGMSINSLLINIDKNYSKQLQNQIVALQTIEYRKNEHKLKLRMNQLTSNLSRSIPHEIRTPFLHIIALSDILLKHNDIAILDDSSEIKDIINDLHSAAKRLNTVLDNYIYYANLITKSFNIDEIRYENQNYTEDVDAIIYELAHEIAYKHKRINDLVLNNSSATVVGSPSIVNKLLLEIIDNAFEFSDDGSKVQIDVTTLSDYLLIEISDKGLGMSEDEIKSIGPFVQFNRERIEQQGLGLGLSIAIKILAILDGDIDIVSKKGMFTVVTLRLRLAKDIIPEEPVN